MKNTYDTGFDDFIKPKLKTLKDLVENLVPIEWDECKKEGIALEDSHLMIDVSELKAEAVKIRIYMREMGEKMQSQPKAYALWLKWLWEYFFNLTDEDLK